jgi:hypothetical protein
VLDCHAKYGEVEREPGLVDLGRSLGSPGVKLRGFLSELARVNAAVLPKDVFERELDVGMTGHFVWKDRFHRRLRSSCTAHSGPRCRLGRRCRGQALRRDRRTLVCVIRRSPELSTREVTLFAVVAESEELERDGRFDFVVPRRCLLLVRRCRVEREKIAAKRSVEGGSGRGREGSGRDVVS